MGTESPSSHTQLKLYKLIVITYKTINLNEYNIQHDETSILTFINLFNIPI